MRVLRRRDSGRAHLNVQLRAVFAPARNVEGLIAGVVHGVGEVNRRWMSDGTDSLIHAIY